MSARAARARTAGFTLVELLISVAILAGISALIFAAFSGLKRSKEGIERVGDRYREGRLALDQISRDLQSAYLSLHAPIDQSLLVQKTGFKGARGNPADRIDFNSFAHRRLDRDSHESDQAEISYFGSADPKQRSVMDLARRVSPRLDLYPEKGGRVDVVATDIDLFDVSYLDPLTGQWTESWDTAQATGQLNRLPLQVRIVLVLNGGRRTSADRAQQVIRLTTKVPIPIQRPLTFATQ
jgi:general secretion pathway protein J